MADTESELTSRIEAALNRIGRLGERFSSTEELLQTSSSLRLELTAEREKLNLLESELDAARDQIESAKIRNAREVDVLGTSLQRSKDELAAASQANGQLARRCSELEETLDRARLQATSSDAKVAQIEQLRQERTADLAELDELLRELKPLVEDVRDA